MKKLLILLFILIFAVSSQLMAFGRKDKEEPEKAEEEKLDFEGEEVGKDELDPWIAKLWAEVEDYRHPIPSDFKGPNGETVTWDRDSLGLTVAEVEKVRAGKYKVGLPWHSLSGEYFTVWRQGTLDACEYLGLEIVAETDAGFDPTKQIEGVESMIPLKPDVLIAAPVDQVTGAAAFQPAVDAGIKLAFVSNIPVGYVKGRDFIGNSTANVYDGSIINVELARDLLGEGGKIGLIVWSVEYWYANYGDSIVVDKIEDYGLEVVDKQGFVSPDDAYNVATSMILNHPEIEGFFITFMVPAMSVVAACVDANRPDIKIITGAYDKPTLLNLAQGGNIAGISTDATYLVGVNSVLLAAYGLLGKEGPEYAVCPYIPFKLENMREVWKIGMRVPLPDYLDSALTEAGY